MIALVGHTSMQLAIAQCLQTSLIMFQATPPLAVVRSWNWTWRQFCSSSWPVLSKPSPNAGGCPGSWFHSLHATSQALQPIQSVVSVKKPTVRAIVVLLSDRHQIGHDLREAALLDVEVERQRDKLVDHRHGRGLLAKIDRDQVSPAALAGVSAQVRKALGVGEDGQLARGLLAAAGTRHALIHPALAASAAQEHARPTHERLARVGQVRELRQAAAAGTAPLRGAARARLAGRVAERFEHRRSRGAAQILIDRRLHLAGKPCRDEAGKIAVPPPLADRGAERRRPRLDRGVDDPTHDAVRLVRHRCDGELVHPIFSMFTRNALNSGVRELASPTNGVSALASQWAPFVGSRSAAMPTKPQWIGMPM